MLLLLAGCEDIFSSDHIPIGIFISAVPTTLLEVHDTIVLSAGAYEKGGAIIEGAVKWTSLDPAVAVVSTKGQVIGKAPGHTTVRATAGAFSMDVQITVKPRTAVPPANTVCAGSGPRHFGYVGSETWKAKDNPHFIRDTLRVGSLTIEAGALICAFPGARIIVPDTSQLIAVGTAAQPIRFIPTDATIGWTGIANGGSSLFDHVRVEKAQTLGLAFVPITGGGSFLTSMTLRNSVVDSGNVQISDGTVENTVIRRGNLQILGTRQGQRRVRIDGVRIEDSPGIALIVGYIFNINTPLPTVDFVTPPVIVRADTTVVSMPLGNFLQAWPTPAAQAALLDNASRTVFLWTAISHPGSVHLRGGLIWQLAGVTALNTLASLTLDAGAELNLQALFSIGVFHANGTESEPVTLSSNPGCWGASGGCGITVLDSASSRISNLRVVNSYLRFAH
jgi:hypothetical protein